MVIEPEVVPPLITPPPRTSTPPLPAPTVPPRPLTVTTPAPAACTVAPLTSMPRNVPVVAVPCWFALNVNAPSTVVMLEPLASEIFVAVVRAMIPPPLVARSLVVFGKLIVLIAKPARLLPEASVTAPLNVIVLNSPPPAEPIVRLDVRSGKAFTTIVSAALPRLIVSELVGFENVVASNVAPLNVERPLAAVPSSASVAGVVGPAGRLKITSVAVPELVTGSRPV